MKRLSILGLVVSVAVASVGVSFAQGASDTFNLTAAVRDAVAAGSCDAPTIEGTGYSGSVYFSPANAFDGITVSTSANAKLRWLDKYTASGNSNGKVYALYRVPDNFRAGLGFQLVSYTLWRMASDGTYDPPRVPVAWELYGVRDDGTEVLIHQGARSYASWGSSINDTTRKGTFEIEGEVEAFRAFKFVPRATASSDVVPFGLFEIEFMVTPSGGEYVGSSYTYNRLARSLEVTAILGEIAEPVDLLLEDVRADGSVTTNTLAQGISDERSSYLIESLPPREHTLTLLAVKSDGTIVADSAYQLYADPYIDNKSVLNLKGAPNTTYNHAVYGINAKQVVKTSDSYTIGLWLQINHTTMSGRAYGNIISQAGDAQHMFRITYDPENNRIDYWRRTGWADAADGSWHTYCNVPNDKEWHYLTAVYDRENGKRRLYIDGVLQTEDDDARISTPTPALSVGHLNYANCLLGKMAEISIWQKALSAEEIGTLMQARPIDFTDCLGYWPLDEDHNSPVARNLVTDNHLFILSPAVQVLEETNDFPPYTVADPTVSDYLKVVHPSDRVKVTINGENTSEGTYIRNSTVTITASTTVPGATFYGWCGHTNNATINGETISLQITQATALSPIYLLGNWVYSAGTISDGYWKLNVGNSSGNLTINSDAKIGTDFAKKSLSPILDLSKPITDSSGTSYQIISIGPAVFMGNPYLETVYLPETLKTITNGNQYNGAFADCSELRRVIPFLPKSVTGLGLAIFRNCTKLESPLHLHNVATIEKQTFEYCRSIPSITTYGNTTSFADSSIMSMTGVRTFTMPNKPGFGNYNIIPGWSQYQCRCIIDPENSDWISHMADSTSFTPWDNLSVTIQNQYFERFPDQPKPLGLSKRFPFQQWLCKPTGVPTLIYFY